MKEDNKHQSGKEAEFPPSGLPGDAVRLFITLGRIHHSEVERRVAHLGIHHSQHRMLMLLARTEEAPSQRELADALDISPAAVTSTLKCLEREGYIDRCMTDEDNRRNRVTITEKGRRKVMESHMIFDSVDKTMFRGMSEEELATFMAFLRRMCANLQQLDTTTTDIVPEEKR